MDDAEPFDYAEMELMQAGMWATTKVLHSTSWRVEGRELQRFAHPDDMNHDSGRPQ
jgi:hypothetical protein